MAVRGGYVAALTRPRIYQGLSTADFLTGTTPVYQLAMKIRW